MARLEDRGVAVICLRATRTTKETATQLEGVCSEGRVPQEELHVHLYCGVPVVARTGKGVAPATLPVAAATDVDDLALLVQVPGGGKGKYGHMQRDAME